MPNGTGCVTASKCFFFVVLAVISWIPAAHLAAATYTWDGGGADNNITTPQNWVGDTVPVANSDIIWAGTVRLNVNINVGGPARTVSFSNTAGAFILSGAAVSMSNGFTNNSANLQTLNLPLTLTAAQTISAASGNFAFGGATMDLGSFVHTIDGAYNTTISNVISNTGGLTKTGAGILTLSGANTFTGTINLNGGVLAINNESRLGNTGSTANLTLNGGTLRSYGSAVNIATSSRNFVLGASGGTFDTVTNLTIDNPISGAGSLTKTGSGTLFLTDPNTYAGATIINAGTLAFGAANDRLADTSAVIVAAGATLDLVQYSDTVASIAGAGTIRTSTASSTLTFGNAAATTFSGTISDGAGTGIALGLVKQGSGTTTLTGANTYDGATTINAGALNVRHATALGSTFGNTIIASGAALEVQGGIAVGAEALTLNGTGIASGGALRNISGNNSWSGALTLGSAAAISSDAGTLTLSGAIANGNANLTLGGAGNIVASNVVSGSGGLVKNGAGSLTLSGVNTYSGNSTINGGTVIANSASSLGTGTLTLNGATLQIAGGFSTSRAISLGNSASTFQIDPSQTHTVTSAISGAGALNKTGAGTMVVTGSNIYSGGTNLAAGTLRLGANDRLADAGQVNVSGGTFEMQSYNETVGVVTVTGGAITGTGTLTGSSYNLQGGSVSVGLGGTAGLTKSAAGTTVLSGANTFTGATAINAGTLTLAATSGSALGGTSAVTVNNGGTILLGGANQINNSAPITLAGGTFAKGDFSEGTASARGLGALTLTASGSHLDFSTGAVGVLNFASFVPGANTLAIDNWTGVANTLGSASTDRLIFNASQANNLNSFAFTGYAPGATQFDLGSGFYEVAPVTPVPEPATYAAGLLTLAAIAYHQRRRLLALRRRLQGAPE